MIGLMTLAGRVAVITGGLLPEEIARVVEFLIDDAARIVTGSVLALSKGE